MSLSHELFEAILGFLSLDDKQGQQSLRNCSLVAKSWVNPSRRYLFKTVEIQETTCKSWLDTISPVNDELLQHVRSLSYIADNTAWRHNLRSDHCANVLRDYLPSFHKLQHLSLSSMHIRSGVSRHIEVFSAFRHTLSQLTLKYCNVTISALVALINYFSSLDRLNLCCLFHQVDGEPLCPRSHSLIRKLHISDFHGDGHDILDQLSELGPAFDELVIDGSSKILLPTLNHIVASLGVNVKRLRLLQTFLVCTYITRVRGPLNLTPYSYRSLKRRVYTALSLPGAPGIRVGCDASGDQGSKLPFFCHLHQRSKGHSRLPELSLELMV